MVVCLFWAPPKSPVSNYDAGLFFFAPADVNHHLVGRDRDLGRDGYQSNKLFLDALRQPA